MVLRRSWALKALQSTGQGLPRATLQELLSDSSPQVRLATLPLLRQAGQKLVGSHLVHVWEALRYAKSVGL